LYYSIIRIYQIKGFKIILNKQTQLEQFRKFYKEYKPTNIEDAIEKFAIFGGVSWDRLDTSKSTYNLIEELILPDFKYIRNDITELTGGMPLYHSILTGLAVGNGQTHTAFKRVNVSSMVGLQAIDELCDIGIIKLKKSHSKDISDKAYFTSPFLKFWFAFVSPIFKGIRDGEYSEIKDRFKNKEFDFVSAKFRELSYEILKSSFKKENDVVFKIGEYWDETASLDIYAKTKSGKIIVGVTKYTNTKLKKTELTKLQNLAQELGIKADIFVLVSKKGFSTELKSLKSDTIRLYSAKNLKNLLND